MKKFGSVLESMFTSVLGHLSIPKIMLCLVLPFFIFFTLTLLPAQQDFSRMSEESLRNLLNDSASVNQVNILNALILHSAENGDSAAVELGQRASKIAQQISYNKGLAITYYHIGIYYSNTFQYPSAIECYLKSGNISKKNSYSRLYADNMNNIGVIYDYQGDYLKAME